MEQQLLVPKQEIEELEITYEPYCEDNTDYVVPKEELADISPDLDATDQKLVNVFVPIQTETMLSKEIADLKRTIKSEPFEVETSYDADTVSIFDGSAASMYGSASVTTTKGNTMFQTSITECTIDADTQVLNKDVYYNQDHIKTEVVEPHSEIEQIIVKIEPSDVTGNTEKSNTVRGKKKNAYTSTLNEETNKKKEKPKEFVCEVCKMKFTRKRYLSKHAWTHSGVKPYNCDYCQKTFAQRYRLNVHLSTHTDDKPFSCEYCHYKCTDRSSLNKHIRTHTGEKPFTCDLCKKSFSLKSSLKSHINFHSGRKPYSCTYCDYTCAEKSYLKKHISNHTGKKPYFCHLCDYKAINSSRLKAHVRIHNGEKPFSCKDCPYMCANKSSLTTHARIHSGERPYSCEQCDYKTISASRLKTHMRTHSGEKPFSCKLCRYKCSDKSNLNTHMKTHASD